MHHNLGLSPPNQLSHRTLKRNSSAPDGGAGLEFTAVELSANSAKWRKNTNAVTPDNAANIIPSCFDLVQFGQRLQAHPEISENPAALQENLVACVRDSEVRGLTHSSSLCLLI